MSNIKLAWGATHATEAKCETAALAASPPSPHPHLWQPPSLHDCMDVEGAPVNNPIVGGDELGNRADPCLRLVRGMSWVMEPNQA